MSRNTTRASRTKGAPQPYRCKTSSCPPGPSTRSTLPCITAKSSALPGSSVPAAPNYCRCSSASPPPLPLAPRSPTEAIAAGLALVPEDRKQHGLILEMGIHHNIGLPGLKRHCLQGGFANAKRETADTLAMIEDLSIRTPGPEQITQYLSGGNQQKVVLGKWLALEPRVLLLDEPTRGVDVGAKEEIYHLMEKLAENGVAILFASSEMEEILGMSDRTFVMHEGRITGQLEREDLSEERIMHLATGRTA